MGSNPTRVALFSFYVKKKLLGLVAKRFFHVFSIQIIILIYHPPNSAEGLPLVLFINPRRACAERVTVVVSYVCVCVCLSVCMSAHTLFWQYAQLEV